MSTPLSPRTPENPEPSWDTLSLLSVDRRGALFMGELAGETACVLRVAPAAVESMLRRRDAVQALTATRRVVALDLDAEPAWIAVEQPYGSLATHPPQDAAHALSVLVDVATALDAAHRASVVHGALGPGAVALDPAGRATLCFHGVPVDPVETYAPEHDPEAPRTSGDAFGLGQVVFAVLDAVDDVDTHATLARWAERLCDADPAARPTPLELLRALGVESTHEAPWIVTGALAPGVVHATHDQRAVIVSQVADGHALAERLSAAQHPSLPQVVAVAPSGVAFAHPGLSFAMCSAPTLGVLARVASALKAAHAVGVAHGRLSAELLWVADDDRVVVMGFGLAPDADAAADLAALCALLPHEPGLSAFETMAALSEELGRRAGHAAASVEQHPRTPTAAGSVLTHRFEWTLRASPLEVWPLVANTERVNRALGLGAVVQTVVTSDEGPAIHGRSSQAGFELAWRERPHEWLCGRRLGVVREYTQGPLLWLRSTVELRATEAGGTQLIHTLESEPRNMLARGVAALEIGIRMKRGLDRVYQRIDAHLAGELPRRGALEADAFEDPSPLSGAKDHALTALERRVVDAGADPEAARRIAELVRSAPAAELSRLRPLALATRFGIEDERMISACLWAVAEGLLVAGWDLMCPGCRAPSGYAETLAQLSAQGRCDVCDVDYALDLGAHVELVLTPHPSLREADGGTYCLSSPAHAPHVVAQVTLAPGERLVVPLALGAGAWRLTGAGAPIELAIGWAASLPWRAELALSAPASKLKLAEGPQELTLDNDTPRTLRLRVEAAAVRQDALTAARVAAHPLFWRVFPGTQLAKGVTVSAAAMAFVAEDGRVTAFDDVSSALLHALDIAEQEGRASVEIGPVGATGALEYAGPGRDAAIAGCALAAPREIVMGPAASCDPAVLALTQALEAEGRITRAGSAGRSATRLRAL